MARRSSLRAGDLIHVQWEDISSRSGWRDEADIDDMKKPWLAETVGWLTCDEADGIILTATRTTNVTVPRSADIWRIPRGVIHRISLIRKGK